MNCKLTIAYDGSKYFGSQIQPNKITIESALLKALKILNINTTIIFSGRTDRGVHATGQVINIEVPKYWNNLNKLKEKLNFTLPKSIHIKSIKKVDNSFHARFSAKKRSYRYIVSTKEANPFENEFISFINEVNEGKIKEAIKLFMGKYDFKNFCKEGSDPNSTIRTIYHTNFYKYKDYYVFKFTSNGFLRSQIRLMVGFLLEISKGNLTKDDLINHLKSDNPKNRFKRPAPPNGLYLSQVIYS